MAQTDEFGGIALDDADEFGGLPPNHPNARAAALAPDEFGGLPVMAGPAAPPDYWMRDYSGPAIAQSTREILRGTPEVAPVGITGAQVSPLQQVAAGYSTLPPSPEVPPQFNLDKDLATMREHWGPQWTLDEMGNPVPSPGAVEDMARTGVSKAAAIPYQVGAGALRAGGTLAGFVGGENPNANLTAAQLREKKDRAQTDLNDAIDDYSNASRGQKMRTLPNGLFVPAENPTEAQSEALARLFTAHRALDDLAKGAQEPEGHIRQAFRDAAPEMLSDADRIAAYERKNNAAFQPSPQEEFKTNLGNRIVGGAVDAASMAAQSALGPGGVLSITSEAFEKSYQNAMADVPADVQADPAKLAEFKRNARMEATKDALAMTAQMGTYHLTNAATAAGLRAFLPEAGTGVKLAAGTVANMGGSMLNRAATGEPIAPGLEGTMADAALAALGVKQHAEAAAAAKTAAEARAKGALPDTPGMRESYDTNQQAHQKVLRALQAGADVPPANEFDHLTDRLAFFGTSGQPVVIRPGERIDVFEHIAKLPGNEINPQVATLPDGRRILYDPTLADSQGKLLTPDADAAINHLGLDLEPAKPAEHPEGTPKTEPIPATAPEPVEPYVGPGSQPFRRAEAAEAFSPPDRGNITTPQAAEALRSQLAGQEQLRAQQAAAQRQQQLRNQVPTDLNRPPGVRAGYENDWQRLLAAKDEGRAAAQTPQAADALARRLGIQATQTPRTGAPRATSPARTEPPRGAGEYDPAMLNHEENKRILAEIVDIMQAHRGSPNDGSARIENGVRNFIANMAEAEHSGDIETMAREGRHLRELHEAAQKFKTTEPGEEAGAPRWKASDYAKPQLDKEAEALANLRQQQEGRLSPEDQGKLESATDPARLARYEKKLAGMTDIQFSREAGRLDVSATPGWMKERIQQEGTRRHQEETRKETRAAGGTNPIIDFIRENGGIRGLSQGRKGFGGGELEALRNATPATKRRVMQNDRGEPGNQAIENLAEAAVRKGLLPEGSGPQDLIDAAEREVKTARKQRTTINEPDLLGHEEPGPEQVMAARQKAEARAELERRFGRKLEAKDLDTTGDLFGADKSANPLFALRGQENKGGSTNENDALRSTPSEGRPQSDSGMRRPLDDTGENDRRGASATVDDAGRGRGGEVPAGKLPGIAEARERERARELDQAFNARGGAREQAQALARRMGGGKVIFDTGRKDSAYIRPNEDGYIEFNLPRMPHEKDVGRGYTAELAEARIKKVVSEELIHFAQATVFRDEWQRQGSKGSFTDFWHKRNQEIYDSVRTTEANLRRSGNVEAADKIRQLLSDSNAVYEGRSNPFDDMGRNHIPELIRQVIQLSREGESSEAISYLHPLVEKLRAWGEAILAKLKSAAGSIRAGQWGDPLRQAIEDTEARLDGKTAPSDAKFTQGDLFDMMEDRGVVGEPEIGTKEERKTFTQRNAEHDARKAAFDQLTREDKFDLANENIEAQNPRRNFLSSTAADVGEHLKSAATGLHAAVKSVTDFLNPAGASEQAGGTARNIREHNARAEREAAIAKSALKAAEKAVDKLDPKRSLAAMDAIETGKALDDPQLKPIVDAMKEGYDKRIAAIRRLVPGAMEHLIKNYLVHLWKDPKAAEEFYGEAMMRPDRENASLEGAKGFMKKREIPTTLDGVAWRSEKYPNGMEPLSWNFVKMTRLKYQEMDRFIMGQKIFGEERRAGRAVFVPADGHAPAGTVPIDDKIARVYAPPWVEVHEFNDPLVTEKLGKIIDELGFSHRRGWRLSAKPSAAGIAYMERGQMETKFNTPEGVVEHELGHLLDGKYGIWDALTRPPGQETVTLKSGPRAGETVTRTRRTPADETAARVTINKELRALADLRMENIEDKVSGHFKKYIRNKEEKIANAVNALIYAPDRMKEVAPTVYKNLVEFLSARPELKPILEIRNSLRLGENVNKMPLKGHRLLGQYYAPTESARVLNNFLAPGWGGAPAYDALRASANLLNAAQLGWSGFHAGFVAVDTTLSKFSLALMQASQGTQDIFSGRFGKGAANIGRAAINAAKFGAGVGTLGAASLGEAFYKGQRMIKEYERPGSVGGIVSEMVDKAIMGGWAPHMDSHYRIGAMAGFREAVKDGKYFTAALKSPVAAVEMGMYPIMEVLVPRMKAAVIYDMMKWEAKELPRDATADQIRTVAARVSDHVDNRLGQLRYDNLFLNKKFKDALMLAQRSLGWNLGTLRELGGGVVHAADMPGRLKRGERMLTHDTAYLLAILAGVPMMGALYQFLHTSQLPQDEKDLFAPRTGRMMPDGTPERVMLPSYAKDLHSYGVHPGQTIVNKLNPLWNSLISALWTNKDFYGTQVRDPNASPLTQAGQVAKFGAKQFLPFSYTAAGRRVSGPGSGIESFFGIQPAPADIRRSPAQNLISEYFQSKGTSGAVTPEAKADKDTARAVSDILRNNAYQMPADLRERLDSLPVAAQIKALKEGTSTPMQLAFKLLPLDVAEQVYQAATPRERDQLEALLDKKRENAEKKKASQKKQVDKLRSAG